MIEADFAVLCIAAQISNLTSSFLVYYTKRILLTIV